MKSAAANPADGQTSAAGPAGDVLAMGSAVGLLASLVAAVFWQSRDFGLVFFDDGGRLAPLVADGLTWSGIRRAWTAWPGGDWRPLTSLSFLIDAALFGDWWGGYHLHSAVLHGAASAILFAALTRLTGAMGRSLVAAAVFAIHPLRAESVGWLAGRADVLGGLFLAATLLAYAFLVERPGSWRRSAAVLGCFVAGLLSSGMLVTLPLGLLVLDWWPLRRLAPFAGGWGFARAVGRRVRSDVGRRPLAELAVEKVPLAAVAAASVLATSFLTTADAAAPPFVARIASCMTACARHVLQLFWPVGLSPRAAVQADVPGIPVMLAAGGLIVALTAAAWFWRRRWPSFTAGWAWYGVMLLPLAGLIPGIVPPTSDRATYFSQIWLIVAVVWGMADRVEKLPVPKGVSWSAALMGLLLLTWGSWAQTRTWHDAVTLQRRTLAVQPGLPDGPGDPVASHQRATAINPTFAGSWLHLGDALLADGRGPAAEQAWKKAVALEPGMAAAWIRLAQACMERGDWAAALPLAEKSATAKGGSPAAATLAWALEHNDRHDEAIATFRRALEGEPDSALLLFNFARLLDRRGAAVEAAAVYRRAAERLRAVGNFELANGAAARAAAIEDRSKPPRQR